MRSSSKTSRRSSRKQAGGSKHKKHSGSKSRSGSKKRSGSKSGSKSRSSSSSGSKGKLGAEECMCMRCKKAVTPKDSKKIKNGNRCRLVGKCPHCGTNVGKFCKCD